MYEKPQYLTPDGYRRLSKSPSKDGNLKKEISDFLAYKIYRNGTNQVSTNNQLQNTKSVNPYVARFLRSKHQVQPAISENAAKLIALAIKGLLKSK